MMANRTRIDETKVASARNELAELLRNEGRVTTDMVRVTAEFLDRSERTVWRHVAELAQELGIDQDGPVELEVRETEYTGVDAVLRRMPFSFADPELKRVVLAYGGNLSALRRDAVSLAEQLELPGPYSYPYLADKFRVELRADERAMIRNGIRGFKAASIYARWSAGYRNEAWQIDATELDLWIRPQGTTTRVRPNALFIVDDHSRVILAAMLLLHDYNAQDSAACVHLAMRVRDVILPDGRVVTIGGVPEKVLCDNALQFTGQVLTHLALDVGFSMVAVAAYAGEKKGKVERVIRSANEDFAKRLPGYANRNLKTLSLKDHLGARTEDLLDEQQALDELGKWVEEWNNNPHPTLTGKSRYEVWADSNGAIAAVPEDKMRPATVQMPRSSYTYHKDGFRITRDRQKRFYLDTSLTLNVGDRYLLRHLPQATDWMDAYDLEGRFIARCFDSEMLDKETRDSLEQRRFQTYRELASQRSDAVSLRALAAAAVRDTAERPNPLAVAHQRALDPAPDLIAASLAGGALPQLTAGQQNQPSTTPDEPTATPDEPSATPDDPTVEMTVEEVTVSPAQPTPDTPLTDRMSQEIDGLLDDLLGHREAS